MNTAKMLCLTVVMMCMPQVACGQEEAPVQDVEEVPSPLRVATKVAQPFVIDEGVDLSGLSVDLWRAMARELGVEYEFVVTDLEDALDGVAAGRYDAAISAISVTPDREQRLDMTHAYFTDGLGIAVPAGSESPSWMRAISNMFTVGFMTAVGALLVLLMVVGILVWLVERKKNSEDFKQAPGVGIGDGFWFAAVTMTTVGYGDKSPKTAPGRVISFVWMFASIIVISTFTGAIASSLTTAQITGGVRAVEDLGAAKTGAVAGSATVDALRDRNVRAKPYDTIGEGLEALASGEIEAFVHDWSILQYNVSREFPGEIRLLDTKFNIGSYAIALPQDSEYREPLNQAILRVTRDAAWDTTVRGYLDP